MTGQAQSAGVRRLRRQRLGIATTLTVLLLLLLSPAAPPVHAASSAVGCGDNRNAELVDAIVAANSGGPNTVRLTAGCTYIVDSVLTISGNITIAGNGAILDSGRWNSGGGFVPGSGLFRVTTGASFAISDLTIRKHPSIAHGGALYVQGGSVIVSRSTLSDNIAYNGHDGGAAYLDGGSLTLIDSTVSGNYADDGGGLYLKSGVMTLVNTTVSENKSGLTDPSYYGGGLYMEGGTLSLTNSTVSDNSSFNWGGGLYIQGGTVNLNYSVIRDNRADRGGGGIAVGDVETTPVATVNLFHTTVENNISNVSHGFFGGAGLFLNGGTVTLTTSILRGNNAHPFGGGAYLRGGNLTLTDSTVADNEATYGGGLASTGGTLSVTGSTVSGNRARTSGGGLRVQKPGTATITNSTISGNRADSGFVDSDTYGGGIDALGSITLLNSTISGNIAANPSADGFGGGITFGVNAAVSLTNTLIAANSAFSGTENCLGSGAITNGGGNLQDQGTTCGSSIPTTANAGLAGDGGRTSGLSANGGPTKTVALQAGSPAINAGIACTAAPVSNRDQRGFTRAGTCDIGAFEVNASPAQRALTVSMPRTGVGMVTSAPSGILCGTTCQANFPDGTTVTLTAMPTSDSTFTGWTGACTGTAECSVTMDSVHTVAATFTFLPGRPETTITAQPGALSNSAGAGFSFTGTDDITPPAGLTFECKLDAASFTGCTSPHSYAGLGDGSHTFQVRALNADGNVDPSPAEFTWIVDTTAPQTTITGGQPTNPSRQTSVSLSFSSSEPGSSFECKLDAGAFETCASPKSYTNLGDGSHTLSVRAKDGAGNIDATPASITWTVDATAPDTSILTGPPTATNQISAAFTFSATEAGSSFECKVDAAAFAPCNSPASYAALSAGSHTFLVRSTDTAGNTDATPASATWLVDTAPPDTMLTAQPPAQSTSSAPSFAFTGSDTGGSGVAGFECRLDGGSFSACTSPKSYSNVPDGMHTFEVRAKDTAGNVDGSPAGVTWMLDATPPTTTAMVNPPLVGGAARGAVTITLNATDGTGSGVAGTHYKLDGGAWTAYTVPIKVSSGGPHTLLYRSTDNAGNQEPDNTLAFAIDTTPPEFFYQFDPATREVQVFGRDEANGSGLTTDGPIAPATCVAQRAGKQCLYRVADKAGNTTSLTLLITTSANQTRVRVPSLQYSGQPASTPLANETVFDFTLTGGKVATLAQCANVASPPALGQPSSSRRLCARWSGADTTLEFIAPAAPNQTRPAMALLRVLTNKGAVTIEIP